jgi:hypothetical protein
VAFLLLVLHPSPGAAQVSAENRAAAQALFDQGRTLIKAGRTGEACPKFEESQRLDPGVGTQLNLADCYERTGRTASAWTLYIEVASSARQAGQEERAALATKRAAALKDKLSRLVITVPTEAKVAGLVVERGALTVGEAQLGAPMPVDPGKQTVKVTAPGKVAWQTTIEIAADGSTKTITVPPLKDAPVTESPGASAGADVASTSSSSSQKTIALAVGGLGIAGLAVGGIFGGIAMSKKNDARCDGNVCASEEQSSTYKSAQKAGTVSTIAFAVGGAALAGAVVLYLTAPKAPSTGAASLGAQASIGPGAVEVRAGASW